MREHLLRRYEAHAAACDDCRGASEAGMCETGRALWSDYRRAMAVDRDADVDPNLNERARRAGIVWSLIFPWSGGQRSTYSARVGTRGKELRRNEFETVEGAVTWIECEIRALLAERRP